MISRWNCITEEDSVLKLEYGILIKCIFCQIQWISPHSLLAVQSVDA